MTLEELFGVEAGAGVHADFPYLLLEVDEDLLSAAGLALDEAQSWRPSKVKDLVYRIDPARPEMHQKRHVHVAASKHSSAKAKQVSWNDEGGRHDRHSFNDKFGARADYREVARTALGLAPDAFLEWVEPTRPAAAESLFEAVTWTPYRELPIKIRASRLVADDRADDVRVDSTD